MDAKKAYYLVLIMDQLFYAWQRRKQQAEEMTEEELDAAIATAERKKAELDAQLDAH